MSEIDPDAQRFRDYAEGYTDDSSADPSGREGAPRCSNYHAAVDEDVDCQDVDCLAEREAEKTCIWTLDDIDNLWSTACGEAFCFTDEGPERNKYKFCPACGLLLLAVRPLRCAGYNYPEGETCGNTCDEGKLCDDCAAVKKEVELALENEAYMEEHGKAAFQAYPTLTDEGE